MVGVEKDRPSGGIKASIGHLKIGSMNNALEEKGRLQRGSSAIGKPKVSKRGKAT